MDRSETRDLTTFFVPGLGFGEMIGNHVDKAGNSAPTTNGIIHYETDGIHVVPAQQ